MPTAKIGDIDLYYRVHGDGFPLIMIQGFSGGHDAWFFQTRAFKKHFQVIVFDNRGIGKTPLSPSPYTIKTMADDAVGLLKHLDIEKAHVLGMSLGGMVAQEVAISYPEMVEKLVLVCTSMGQGDTVDVAPELLKALEVKEDGTRPDLRNIDFANTSCTVVSLAFNKRFYRAILVPMARFQMRRARLEGQLAQMEAITGHSTDGRLHLIKAPTLVIAGTKDRLISPKSSDELAKRITGAKLVKLEGGSHAFFIEMRKQLNKEILDFLKNA